MNKGRIHLFAGRAGVADRGGNGAPSGSHGGASRPSAISRSKAISMSQTGSKPGGGMAKHEGPAAAHYWLPRPAFGGSAGKSRAHSCRISRFLRSETCSSRQSAHVAAGV